MYRAPAIQDRHATGEPAPVWRDARMPAPPPQAAPRGRRIRWRLVRIAIILGVWGLLLAAGTLAWFARDLPRPEDALDSVRRPSLVLQDRAGATIATYGDVVGEALRLPNLPRFLPDAAVSVEDRRFWTHGGLDFYGIARALVVDVLARRVVQGGSTITQQVAKTLFLSNARTLRRKVQEVLLTLWLERHFSKTEILEIWLNRVYLGSGAWGVDAASQIYFGVSARRLNLWQSAVIAGLPRAPSRFNPRTDPEAAAARGREVLAAMVANGAINQAQADQATAAHAFPHPPPGQGLVRRLGRRRRAIGRAGRVGRSGTRHARPAGADCGRNAPGRPAGRSGRPRRRHPRCRGGAGRIGRRGARAGGRPRLRTRRLQPRHRRSPPARLRLQAVRMAGRLGTRHASGGHGAGRAAAHRELEPTEFRAGFPR